MAIEGPLKELGIHDVFQLLDLNRKTGVLTVTSPLRHNRGTIYFDSGSIVYANIQSNPHPLGGLLVRKGKITEADLHRARDIQQRGDKRRLGEILVAIGSLSHRELERHVRFQVEEVVFEILNWREGYFSFVEGPLKAVGADATVQVSTESVLMEGARRIDEWSRIEKKIPSLGVIPALAPAENGAGVLDLLPGDWEVLAMIDGARPLREIAKVLSRSEFEVAKTVFGLESAGLIAIREPRRTTGAAPAAVAELEASVAEAEGALARGDIAVAERMVQDIRQSQHDSPSVCVLVGRVHLARERSADAEAEFRRALRLDPMHSLAHRLMGTAVALQGRLTDAIEWWERWLRLEASLESAGAETERLGVVLQAAQTLDAFLRDTRG